MLKPLHAYYYKLPYTEGCDLLENRPGNFGTGTHGIVLTDENGEIRKPKIHGRTFKLSDEDAAMLWPKKK